MNWRFIIKSIYKEKKPRENYNTFFLKNKCHVMLLTNVLFIYFELNFFGAHIFIMFIPNLHLVIQAEYNSNIISE